MDGASKNHPSFAINFIVSSLVVSKALQSSLQIIPRICHHVSVHYCNYLSEPCGEVINVNYECFKNMVFHITTEKEIKCVTPRLIAGQGIGPPLPIHWSGKRMSSDLLTCKPQCEEAQSCWKITSPT